MNQHNTLTARQRRIITAAVRSACSWSVRHHHGAVAMKEICRMTGVIMEAHGPGLSPAGPIELVRKLKLPLRGLLLPDHDPEIGAIELLTKAGELTDDAYDLAADHACPLDRTGADLGSWLPRWARMRSEQVSGEVFSKLVEKNDQEVYVNSRTFIIDHPAGLATTLPDERVKAGARAAGEYGALSAHQTYVDDHGAQHWWPCPVCKYPMTVESDESRCRYRWHRAKFQLDSTARRPRLIKIAPNDPHPAPAAQRAEGVDCVEPAVWRSVVVPGVTELRIAQRLRKYSKVELWPDFDSYDLQVVTGDFHYDVKEYASVTRLVEHLREKPARARILIPRTHDHQVAELRQAGFAVSSEEDAVKLARSAAKRAGEESR